MIVKREAVAALGQPATSDQQADTIESDVNIKDNIVPIVWADRYEAPAVVGRAAVRVQLQVKSETPNDTTSASDRNIKDNIVPVVWTDGYETPAVLARQRVEGLLDTLKSDTSPDNV